MSESEPRSLPAISPQVFHILLSLVDDDLHGYAIIQEVAARTGGELRLTASTLYAAMKRLLDTGWVEERAAGERVDRGAVDAPRRRDRRPSAPLLPAHEARPGGRPRRSSATRAAGRDGPRQETPAAARRRGAKGVARVTDYTLTPALRVYRRVLALVLPRRFRERFSYQMLAVFAELESEARARAGSRGV